MKLKKIFLLLAFFFFQWENVKLKTLPVMAVRLLFIYLLGDKVMQNLLYMTHMNKPAGGPEKARIYHIWHDLSFTHAFKIHLGIISWSFFKFMIPLIIQIIKQMVQLKIFQFLRFGTILILKCQPHKIVKCYKCYSQVFGHFVGLLLKGLNWPNTNIFFMRSVTRIEEKKSVKVLN